MDSSGLITLAIESALGGGSISLIVGDNEIGGWIGSSAVSKAEELLFNIDALLADHNIDRRDIDLIAVSAGPGSFTGIRIGLATALGLKAGLGIKMASESALKAMAFGWKSSGEITVAVPAGRNAVCFQRFIKKGREVTPLDEPRTLAEGEFADQVESHPQMPLLLHSSLYAKVPASPVVTNFGSNIALAIGAICRESPSVVTQPLFISKSF